MDIFLNVKSVVFFCWMFQDFHHEFSPWLVVHIVAGLLFGFEKYVPPKWNIIQSCIWSNYSYLTRPHPKMWLRKGNLGW